MPHGMAPLVAPETRHKAVLWRFESVREYIVLVLVAQWIARPPPKRQVAGSNPALDARYW